MEGRGNHEILRKHVVIYDHCDDLCVMTHIVGRGYLRFRYLIVWSHKDENIPALYWRLDLFYWLALTGCGMKK